MHPWKKGYVDTPEGQIHYLRGGEGPVLAMLHQNPSSARMWEPVLPGFIARGRTVIAFDTPGYGESDKPAFMPTIPYYAHRFDEALRLLGVEQYDILGHHTGALVAGAMAVRFPQRVRKVVPVGYALLPADMINGLSRAAPQDVSADGHELEYLWKGITRLGGDTFTGDIGVRCLIEKLQAGRDWFWAYRAVSGFEREKTARSITQPTLCIVGRKDPLSQWQPNATAIMPNSRGHVVESGGVNVADDAPDEFVDVIDQFLRE
jgi:pimeloyl-ACP methyl ester carboxylesterase